MIKIEVEETKLFVQQKWFSKDVIEFLESHNFELIYRDFEYFRNQYNLLFVRKCESLEVSKKFMEEYWRQDVLISFRDCFINLIKQRHFKVELKSFILQFIGPNLRNMLKKIGLTRSS